jgi:hypothetical protein
MFATLKERTGRIGDALLTRLAPKADAEAVCAGWVACCAPVDATGTRRRGTWRYDPEHAGVCTPCMNLTTITCF